MLRTIKDIHFPVNCKFSSYHFCQVVTSWSAIYWKVGAPAGGVDDMTKLSYLVEPRVLQSLKYTGAILIAVNVFDNLPELYDAHETGEQYKGATFGELGPHV
ncbi:unnamed protein product [Ilex paraguariensis]|uniref:Uncharacterized protein n=1 Tax=Ilex paraguariensis TaxID=185542 RepID=A0ABC8RYI3_9AQUA